MKVSDLRGQSLKTPCYVYDKQGIQCVLDVINEIAACANVKFLYSIKAANNVGLLEFIQPDVHGFSCSSLNELRLASEILQDEQSLHITSPIYKNSEWTSIHQLADFISINSLSQWQGLTAAGYGNASLGIRFNPELSFVKDSRYDPCHPGSKLGVNAFELKEAIDSKIIVSEQIRGIHVHNNCESIDFSEWQRTIERLLKIITDLKIIPDWINLGGGYLFHDSECKQLVSILKSFKAQVDSDIYIEPGKAVVGHTGYLIASIIDIKKSEQGNIAILDSSINHLPEVFEYQYQPAVLNSQKNGNHHYKLAGCTCLSGDIFGEYTFEQPLSIDDGIIFDHVGAYMQVKANWFNGVNQAATYLFDETAKQFELIMKYDYEDFRRR